MRGVWLIGYIHGKRASSMQHRRTARVGVAPCRRVVVAMEAAAAAAAAVEPSCKRFERATAAARETRMTGRSVNRPVGQWTKTTCSRTRTAQETRGQQARARDDMTAPASLVPGIARLMSGVDVVVRLWSRESGSTVELFHRDVPASAVALRWVVLP
jgi:hypothetical protein